MSCHSYIPTKMSALASYFAKTVIENLSSHTFFIYLFTIFNLKISKTKCCQAYAGSILFHLFYYHHLSRFNQCSYLIAWL